MAMQRWYRRGITTGQRVESAGSAVGRAGRRRSRSARPTPIDRWPSPSSRCAAAPGIAAASHSPWANGTMRSALPCHTVHGHGDRGEVEAPRRGRRRGRRRPSRRSTPRRASRKARASSSPNSPVQVGAVDLGQQRATSRRRSRPAWIVARTPRRSGSRKARTGVLARRARRRTRRCCPAPCRRASRAMPCDSAYGATPASEATARNRSGQQGAAGEHVRAAAGPADGVRPLDPELVEHLRGVGRRVGDAAARPPRRRGVAGPRPRHDAHAAARAPPRRCPSGTARAAGRAVDVDERGRRRRARRRAGRGRGRRQSTRIGHDFSR